MTTLEVYLKLLYLWIVVCQNDKICLVKLIKAFRIIWILGKCHFESYKLTISKV